MKMDREHRPDDYVSDGKTYTLEDVKPGRKWTHYRPGEYETVGYGPDSTNGPDEGTVYVVYKNEVGELKVRKASEFLDGRFRPKL